MTASQPFVGAYAKSVDAKGRVSVPPGFRDILEPAGFKGLYARKNRRNASLECGTQGWLADLRGLQLGLAEDTDEHDDLIYRLVSSAEPLQWDPEGRVTLPKKFLEYTGITNQATFVGKLGHFEIWEPGAFDKRMAKADARDLTLPPRAQGGR
jgi:MraZ protein